MGSKENLPPPGGGRQIQRLNISNIVRKRTACSLVNLRLMHSLIKLLQRAVGKVLKKCLDQKSKQKYQTFG